MLSLLAGQHYRRVGNSTRRGPEYHGPCPVCGGTDRFHVWPEQDGGTFWCRVCGKGGDLIEYYRWAEGLSYRDACARAGVDVREYEPQSAPSPRPERPVGPAFVPHSPEPVAAIWAEHAAKFAAWCHAQLLGNASQLAWLAKRGLDAGLIAKYGLGWNPADSYRPRESWGLETMRRPGGKAKKLWLPLGLVIPQWLDGQVARLRVRRPNPKQGEAKYYVVPGSGREPLMSAPKRSAYVVVESELDAMLLDGVAGDVVGVVSMGNASAKPTERCHAHLAAAVHLSISLDNDPPRRNPFTGRMESPGAQGSRWWLTQYRQADRVPVIGGKDPGEAYQAGVDLRAWVLAGLPPRYRLQVPATDKKSLSVAPVDTDPGPADQDTRPFPAVGEEQPQATPTHAIIVLHSGQEIHVTDNQSVWRQLADSGLIVFSGNELARLQTALAGLQGEARDIAVQAAMDAKTVFPGAYIRRGKINENQAAVAGSDTRPPAVKKCWWHGECA